jgi:hypothetical protein
MRDTINFIIAGLKNNSLSINIIHTHTEITLAHNSNENDIKLLKSIDDCTFLYLVNKCINANAPFKLLSCDMRLVEDFNQNSSGQHSERTALLPFCMRCSNLTWADGISFSHRSCLLDTTTDPFFQKDLSPKVKESLNQNQLLCEDRGNRGDRVTNLIKALESYYFLPGETFLFKREKSTDTDIAFIGYTKDQILTLLLELTQSSCDKVEPFLHSNSDRTSPFKLLSFKPEQASQPKPVPLLRTPIPLYIPGNPPAHQMNQQENQIFTEYLQLSPNQQENQIYTEHLPLLPNQLPRYPHGYPHRPLTVQLQGPPHGYPHGYPHRPLTVQQQGPSNGPPHGYPHRPLTVQLQGPPHEYPHRPLTVQQQGPSNGPPHGYPHRPLTVQQQGHFGPPHGPQTPKDPRGGSGPYYKYLKYKSKYLALKNLIEQDSINNK